MQSFNLELIDYPKKTTQYWHNYWSWTHSQLKQVAFNQIIVKVSRLYIIVTIGKIPDSGLVLNSHGAIILNENESRQRRNNNQINTYYD